MHLEQEAEWARRSPAPIRRAASGRPPRWSISQPIWLSSVTASSSSISIPRATRQAASGSTVPPSTAPSTTRSSTGVPLAELHLRDPRRGRPPRPLVDRPGRRRGRARRRSTAASGASRRALDAERDAWDWILIDCPPSLGHPHGERPDRRRRGARPDPVRVLRARGPDAAHRDDQPRPRPPEPGPRDHGRAPHDVRRPHEPLVRGRRRGPAAPARGRVRDRRPAQRPPVRGPEPRPADRAVPARVEGRRGLRAARARGPRTRPPSGTARPAAAARIGRRARCAGADSSRGSAHDGQGRSQRLGARPRPRVADPAAPDRDGRGRGGAARAHRAEPVPAAPPHRRRRRSRSSRRASASTACSSRCSSPRPSTATSSSPASAACAPPASPASSASPRSSASSRTGTSSRSRSSRTCSAPTSTRSTRRSPTASSIDEFGLTQERVAERVGKARATVANTLRLLDLHAGRPGGDRRGPADRGPRARARRPAGRRPGPRRSARSSSRACRSARPRSSSGGCASRGRAREPAQPRSALDADLERVGGGPPRAPRDEGQPQPVAERRANRDRVLQRRRARPALRAPDRRDCVTDVGDRQRAATTNGRAASRPQGEGRGRPTTPPPASRSSRAWRPSVDAPACTSARPTCAACTTSCGRSSTTRSTRRWPATRRRSSSRSTPTAR